MSFAKGVLAVGNSAGKWLAFYNFVKAFIVAILFLIPGVYLIRRKPEFSKKTTGTVTQSLCSKYKDDKNKEGWECDYDYEYKVDGELFTGKKNNRSSKKIIVGETISVSYSPLDPEYHGVNVINGFWIGVGLIIASIIITLIWGSLWMFTKSTKGAGSVYLGSQVLGVNPLGGSSSQSQPRMQMNQ